MARCTVAPAHSPFAFHPLLVALVVCTSFPPLGSTSSAVIWLRLSPCRWTMLRITHHIAPFVPSQMLHQLDIAIALVDDSTWAYYSHYLAGLAYLQLGDSQQAEQELRTTIEQSDNRPACHKALRILIERVPHYEGRKCR